MHSQSKTHALNVVGFLAGLAYFSFFFKHRVLCNNLLFLSSTLSLFLALSICMQAHEYLKCHIWMEDSLLPIILITHNHCSFKLAKVSIVKNSTKDEFIKERLMTTKVCRDYRSWDLLWIFVYWSGVFMSINSDFDIHFLSVLFSYSLSPNFSTILMFLCRISLLTRLN